MFTLNYIKNCARVRMLKKKISRGLEESVNIKQHNGGTTLRTSISFEGSSAEANVLSNSENGFVDSISLCILHSSGNDETQLGGEKGMSFIQV